MGGAAGRVCCGDVVADAIISSLSLVLFFYMFNIVHTIVIIIISLYHIFFLSSILLLLFCGRQPKLLVGLSYSARGQTLYHRIYHNQGLCADKPRNTVSAYLQAGSLVLQRRTGYCYSWSPGCSEVIRSLRTNGGALGQSGKPDRVAFFHSTSVVAGGGLNKC